MPRRPPAPLDPERAWEYLLTLLARRAYTVEELRRKLLRRGLTEADAQALVSRLERLQLVDDGRYVEQYVAGRRRSRGRLALQRELRRKGVAPSLIGDELAALDERQQREAAEALLRKHAWRYDPRGERAAGSSEATGPGGGGREGTPAPEEERRARERLQRARARAFAFLARRGFTAEAAAAAVEAVGWFDDPAP